MSAPQAVAHDPQLDVDVRALIVESRELARDMVKNVPAVFLNLTPAAIAIYDAYLADALTPEVMENLAAMIAMTLAARDYWVDRLGWDPYREHRVRRLDVLHRIQATYLSQIAAHPPQLPRHVSDSGTWHGHAEAPQSPSVSTTETDYKKEVAGRIRQARTVKGLSQEVLAAVIGTSRSHVNGWENGRSVPRWPNLTLIADALDVTPHWLLTGQDDPTDDAT